MLWVFWLWKTHCIINVTLFFSYPWSISGRWSARSKATATASRASSAGLGMQRSELWFILYTVKNINLYTSIEVYKNVYNRISVWMFNVPLCILNIPILNVNRAGSTSMIRRRPSTSWKWRTKSKSAKLIWSDTLPPKPWNQPKQSRSRRRRHCCKARYLLLRMARSTLPRPLAVCRRPKSTSINSSRIFTKRRLAQFSGWQLWSHLLWRSLLNGSCSFLPFLFLFWFLMIIFFWPRFAKDVKKILSELENCFLGLAECQHTLEAKGKTEDFDAMLQKAKEAARQPSLGFPIHSRTLEH